MLINLDNTAILAARLRLNLRLSPSLNPNILILQLLSLSQSLSAFLSRDSKRKLRVRTLSRETGPSPQRNIAVSITISLGTTTMVTIDHVLRVLIGDNRIIEAGRPIETTIITMVIMVTRQRKVTISEERNMTSH